MTFWTVVLAVVVGNILWAVISSILHDWSSKWLKENQHMKDKRSFHERIEEERKKDNML